MSRSFDLVALWVAAFTFGCAPDSPDSEYGTGHQAAHAAGDRAPADRAAAGGPGIHNR